MKKNTTTSVIVTAAVAAAAAVYLFYTESGIRWRKRVVKDVTNTVDDLLENLENSLAAAENKARDAEEE